VVGGSTYTISATATSGLSTTFSSATTGVCTVSGSTVTFVGAGTCTVNADQAGDGTYSAATRVTQSFNVLARAVTPTIISHPSSASRTVGQSATFSVTATASDGGTLSYVWKKAGVAISPSETGTSYTISSTVTGSAGDFTVTVTNTKNGTTSSVTSNVATLTVVGAPTAPATATLTSSGQSAGALRLSWTVPSSNGGSAITGYEYRYSLSNEEAWTVWTSTTDTATTLTNLGNARTYKAQVRAKNAYGTSAATATANALTGGDTVTALSAPTITSLTPDTSTGSKIRINLTVLAGADSYQYSTDGGVSWKTAAIVTAGVGATSGYIDITTPSGNSNSLVNGTTYPITVRGVNAAGGGSASNSISAVPSKAPGVPTGVSLSLGSAGSMVLAYTAPTDSGGLALTYEYQFKLTSDTSWSGWISIGAGTSVTISGITNGNTYDARVRAKNTTGNSDASSTATLNTVIATGPTITRQPTNLSITSGQSTPSYLTVTATAGAGETLSYQWYKGTQALSGATSETLTVTTASDMGAGEYKVVVVTASKSGTSANVSAKIDAIGTGTLCNAPNSETFFYANRFYAGTADTLKEFHLQFAANTNLTALAGTKIRFYRAAGTNGRHYPDSKASAATRASTTPTDYQLSGEFSYVSISGNIAIFRGNVALPSAGHYWWTVINTSGTQVNFCNSNAADTTSNGWYLYKEGSSWIWFGSFRQNIDGGKFAWNTHPNFRLFTSTTTTTSSTSTTSSTVTVTVNGAPSITTSTVPGATKGSAYSTTLVGSGGTGPYTWRLANGSALPAGLTLSTSGVISGTPTALEVTTANASSGGTLINGGFTSDFTTNPTTGWVRRTTVGGQTVINTVGKTLQFSYGAPACTNQANVTMSEVQQQVTIPTAGTVTFSVKVINNIWNRIGFGYSNPCYDPYEVKIARSNGTVVTTGRKIPTSPTDPLALEHTESVTITTTSANEVVTISLLGMDAGYWAGNYGPIFKEATLTTPGGASGSSSSGTTTFTVELTDANGAKTTKVLTFNVASDITIATKSLGNANRGAPYSQALKATGGAGTLRWSIASGVLPQGLTLSSAGLISGTVAETATSQTLSIAVTDSNTATVSQSYTLNVLSGVPDSPTALTAGTIGSGRVPLTWTAPVDTGGSPITSYIVSYSSGAGTANDGEVVTEDRGSVSVPATGLTFPYLLTGLKNGRPYTITVSAKNAGATSSSSNSVTVTPAAAAGPPQQLSTVLANGGITVKWKKPTSSGGLKVDTYTVQCGESATVINWQDITVRQDTDENGVVSAVVDGVAMTLVKGNSYFCRVRVESGINGVRFNGEWATTATAIKYMTAPNAPSITAVDSATVTTEVKVTFNQSTQDGGSPITSYVASMAKILADGSQEATKRSCSVNRSGETWTAGTKFCSITGVPLKGTFALDLVAVNSVGQSEADTRTVRIPGKTQILTYPATDTNTAFTSGTRTYAKVIGDADFPIKVTTNSGLKLAYANSDTATCTISSSGSIKVVAIGTCVITITQNGLADDGSDTDWEPITGTSETVTVTVAGATPSNPTWVSVTPGNQRLTAVWQAPQGRFSAVTDYVIEYKPSTGSWTTFSDGTSTDTSTAITGLTNGDSYTVRIKAMNGSLASQVVTMPGNFTPANVPDTPTVTSLLVYPDSSTVSLTWGAVAGNGAPVLGYTVTGTADSQTAVSCSTGASTYTCLIGGLKNKNTYTFTITARNSIGTSASSETSTAVAGVSQTITLNTVPKGTGWNVGDPDTQIDASTNSGLPIQYSVVNSAICTVSSTGLVHFVTDGNCQVYLDQDGTNSSTPNGTQTKYSAATRYGSIDMVVAPAKPSAPTITSVTNTNAGLVIAWSASSSGGGTIEYTITGTAAGQTNRTCTTTSLTCTISTVAKGVRYGFSAIAANSIDSSTASSVVYGTWITVPSAPNTSGTTSAASTTDGKALNVYWAKSTTSGGATDDQILSYTATATNAEFGSATCTVNRTSSLDSSGYNCGITGLRAGAAYVVTVRALNIIGLGDTLTVGTLTPGLTQTVSFDTPTASTMTKSFGDSDFQLSTTISSGNTATYSTSSSACTVSSTGVVHIVGAGSCVVTVNHPGATNTTDSQYKSVTETITVTIGAVNPTAPVITRVVPGPTRLTVEWLAPTSNGGGGLTYTATATENGNSQSCTTTSTSCVITSLRDDYEHSITVTARNTSNSSLASTSASATGTPFTNSVSPRPLVATAGNGTIAFTWDSPTAYTGNITSYKLYYKPTSAGSYTTETVTATVFTKTLTGIAANTQYAIQVSAIVDSPTANSEGSLAPVVYATTNSAPGAPQNVNASSIYSSISTTDTMTVSWSAPASNGGSAITGYLVTVTAGGTSSTCTTSGTSCSIGGLIAGTAYTISVVANNGVGAGSAGTASHTTVAPSAAPTLGSVSSNNANGSVTIAWTAPTNTGGLDIRSYVVTAYNTDGTATSYGCTVPAGTLNCTVTGLPYKTTLKFAVSAVTLAGTGTRSDFTDPVNFVLTQSITFETMTAQTFSAGSKVLVASASSGLPVTFTSNDTTICTVSNGVAYFVKIGNCSITASQAGDTRYSAATSVTEEFVINAVAPTPVTLLQVAPGASTLTVKWTPSPSLGGSTLKNYIISWAKNADFSDEQSVTATETSTVISGLESLTAYIVRVAVVSNGSMDNSDWSNRLSAKTFGNPAAPTNVAATSPNAGAATITWTNVPVESNGGTPVTGYRVDAFINGSPLVATSFSCSSPGSNCTISGLSGSTNYVFKVTAINAVGSATSDATTTPVRPGIEQTLSISSASTRHTAGTIQIGATASSGLPISYAVVSESSTATTDSSWGNGRNVCRVDSSGNLTVDLAGTCVISVNQDGTNNGTDTSYLSATEVTATFTVAGDSPTVVSSLEAAAGDREIEVTWSAPSNDGGLPITSYVVTWFRKGERHASLTEGGTSGVTPIEGQYGRVVIAASSLETLHKRITGLTNGITYTIYVQAVNSAGIGPEL
jgi:titin